MRNADVLRFARDAAAGYPLRTSLSVLAMAIGVAGGADLAGDGARLMVEQFSALGGNLVIILPGRSATAVSVRHALTTTPRDRPVDDAFALTQLPSVRRVAPLTGNSRSTPWPAARSRGGRHYRPISTYAASDGAGPFPA